MERLNNFPLALVLALTIPAAACDDGDAAEPAKAADDKKDDAKADAKSDDAADDAAKAEDPKPAEAGADPAAGDAPKEGGSCEGIDKNDGLIACDGNKVIFCSSYSKYVWTKQNECPEGQTCHAEGKSAGCK